MPLMSIRAYARRRRVTHPAVLKAIATGRIHRSANGKIDSEVADREWAENTNEAKPRNSVSGDPHRRRAPGEPSRPTLGDARRHDSDTGRIAGGYAASRAVRESFEARLKQLEYERRKGKLVDADEVRDAYDECARRARALLLAIPDRVAPIVAAISDVADVHRILLDEVRRTCEELSRVPSK